MGTMKKVLLFGSQGLLGQSLFERLSQESNIQLVPLSRFNYNLFFPEEIFRALDDHTPDILLNAVAFANVDAAEKPENENEVFYLNADFPKLLAEESHKRKISLIHFSTDFVFSGEGDFYDEQSLPDPINIYGASKVEGEEGIWENTENALVIRTSRLYGKGKENFVSKIVHLAKRNKPISALFDEQGNFTFTDDLANRIAEFLKREALPVGTLHVAGEEMASPAKVAREIVRLTNSQSVVTEISSDSLSRPAPRPKHPKLVSCRENMLLGFRDALPRFLA